MLAFALFTVFSTRGCWFRLSVTRCVTPKVPSPSFRAALCTAHGSPACFSTKNSQLAFHCTKLRLLRRSSCWKNSWNSDSARAPSLSASYFLTSASACEADGMGRPSSRFICKMQRCSSWGCNRPSRLPSKRRNWARAAPLRLSCDSKISIIRCRCSGSISALQVDDRRRSLGAAAVGLGAGAAAGGGPVPGNQSLVACSSSGIQ
mmetsp:Transcript_18221/g.53091  ORF Transcript_18221/g.53091 Transcript_18221/m.53091 type:complete len:205 (+) Transcript_18221:667-1281(+)